MGKKMRITWDHSSLQLKPSTGVCSVSGAYETGRTYLDENNRPVFVGNTAAPDAVEDYVGFLTSLDTVTAFKRGYAKREWTAARMPVKKKKK